MTQLGRSAGCVPIEIASGVRQSAITGVGRIRSHLVTGAVTPAERIDRGPVAGRGPGFPQLHREGSTRHGAALAAKGTLFPGIDAASIAGAARTALTAATRFLVRGRTSDARVDSRPRIAG
jgi:hypothetical protein